MLHERNGDVQRAARARGNLAEVYNTLCAYPEAEAALRRAVEDCRRVGNRASEGWATLNLGITMTGIESWKQAEHLLLTARAIGRDAPNVSLEASSLLCLARLKLRMCQWSDAAVAAQEAVAFGESHGLKARVAAALGILSSACLARSEAKAALDAAARGIAIRDDVGGLDDGETELFLSYGHALAAAGRVEEARDAFARGRQIVADQTLGISDEEARARFLATPVNRALMEAS
jgi:tetratricopeptide (TPR) repeat protein